MKTSQILTTVGVLLILAGTLYMLPVFVINYQLAVGAIERTTMGQDGALFLIGLFGLMAQGGGFALIWFRDKLFQNKK